MSTKVHERGIGATNPKSLFTAVLYNNVPESSASSSIGEVGTCSTYLKRLTREYLARASMEEEVNPLATGFQSLESKARVAQLTEKVKRAYSEVKGNPADGRWTVISELLRLHSTRGGKHWMGTNTDAKAPEVPKHLCIIPKTSDEWHEIERKRKEEEDVKSKVQRWIKAAEFEPLTPGVTIVQEAATDGGLSSPQATSGAAREPLQRPSHNIPKQSALKGVFNPTDPTLTGSKFGFTVVKRHTIVKDKPSSPKSPPPPSPLPPATSAPSSPGHKADIGLESRAHQPLFLDNDAKSLTSHDVADVADTSFLPFWTSTPLPSCLNGLPPISSTDPLPSPTHSHDCMQTCCRSQKVLLSPSSRLPEPSQSQDGSSRKHRRSSSSQSHGGEPAAKRTRVVEELDELSLPSKPPPDVGDAPSTPPLKNLPRLTELLGSTGRTKRAPPKKKHGSNPPASRLPPAKNAPQVVPPNRQVDIEEFEAREKFEQLVQPATSTTPPLISDPILESVPDQNVTEVKVTISGTGTVSPLHCPEPSSNALLVVALDPQLPEESSGKDSLQDEPKALVQHTEPAFKTPPQPADAETPVEDGLSIQESQCQTPPRSPKSDPFRFPSTGPDSLQSNLEVTSYDLYGLDNLDNPSPTKSLSSLAGSDSESESDEEGGEPTARNVTIPKDLHMLDAEFNPRYTSTQKPGLDLDLSSSAALDVSLPPNSLGWANEKLPSTSQLQAEVNSQVGEFDKFMEADLGYDLVTPGL